MTDIQHLNERRALTRIDCRPMATSHHCTLHRADRSFTMSLEDMHRNGARLRFLDVSSAAAVDQGDHCRFHIHVTRKGLRSEPMHVHIAWKMGSELGVCFHAPLVESPPCLEGALDI